MLFSMFGGFPCCRCFHVVDVRLFVVVVAIAIVVIFIVAHLVVAEAISAQN